MQCPLGIAHTSVALADVTVGNDVVAVTLIAIEMFQDVKETLHGKDELPLPSIEITCRLPCFLHKFLIAGGLCCGDLKVEIYFGSIVGATVGVG